MWCAGAGGGAAPTIPRLPSPVRGPAKCGEVPENGDLGELESQLGDLEFDLELDLEGKLGA